jgi:copper homeostasis protein CutC
MVEKMFRCPVCSQELMELGTAKALGPVKIESFTYLSERGLTPTIGAWTGYWEEDELICSIVYAEIRGSRPFSAD